MRRKIISIFFAGIFVLAFTSCSNDNNNSLNEVSTNVETNDVIEDSQLEEVNLPDLEIKFGDNGETFTIHLYDNETATAIARYVGKSDWNLPIYNFDESDVMEYYDIPSRYEIPSNPEIISNQSAGEVYYSAPNRIILFYKDAEVIGDYTRVGYIDYSDELVDAVENNPVIQGWGNKIVSISRME